jgi:predicted ribonuclease YlaK
MRRAVDKLQGEPLFAYVDLPQTERSATARLADKLD